MGKSICIIGPPATGKTTLALNIVEGNRSQILQMDDISYDFYLLHNRKPNSDEWIQYFLERIQENYLINEGFYKETIEYRLKNSNVIIYYHAGTMRCLFRAIKRGFRNLYTNTTVHEESRANFYERFRYFFSPRIYLRILLFNYKYRGFIQECISQIDMTNKTFFFVKSISDAERVAETVKKMLTLD